MLVPMAKVELIGPKVRFFEVVSLLHDLGTVHFEDMSKKILAGEVPLDKMEVVVNQASERERMEDLLIRLRSIVKALHLPEEPVDELQRQKQYLQLWNMDSKELSVEVTEVIDQVEDRTSSLAQAQSSMEAELALLARYEPILQKIQPLAKQIVTTGAFDSVALLVERRYKGALDELKKELDELTGSQCEIVSTDVDEDTTAVIVVYARRSSDAVHKFLAMENINQIRLPSEFQDMPFDVAYEQIRERRAALPRRLDEIRKELHGLSVKWYTRLTTIRDVLTDKIAQISAIPKFGQTEYAFVITGWVPASLVKDLRRAIVEAFGTDVIVNQLEIDEREFADTPVALTNPKWAQPASFAMSYLMGGKPMYGTIDPSIIWAISYPLIFGMIVGDIGYGIVMLAIILWLRFKFRDKPAVQMATGLLGPAATAAILFGAFYGELFGNVLWSAGWIREIYPFGEAFPLPYNREHVVEPLMYMALGLGVIQILFGLILGAVNGIRTKQMKHAFVKSGLAGFIVGAVILVIAMVLLNSNPVVQIVGAVVMTVGILAVFRWGGIMGFVETLETIGGIASYIRIMAVGLSDAIFATAINKMAANDQIPLPIAIVLLLLFHALHLVLAIFTPTIHALRLNLLEFGGKYYEASKAEYQPFQKTGGEKRA
jgi:V/A-type H+-transporting ATPase subunit I